MTNFDNEPTTPPANNEQAPTIRYEFPAKRPFVTYGLLAITITAFLLQQLSIQLYDLDLVALYLAKINELIYEGQIWRMVTPVFAHGDLMHIGFNMYALLVLGPRLERLYGHWRFAGLYFVSAVAGNLFSFYLTPAASLGASTAIFGLLAAEGIFIFMNRRFFPNAQRALNNLVIILVFNLIYSIAVPSIDLWGHLGGFLGGLSFAWFAGPMIQILRTDGELTLVDQHNNNSAITTTILHFAVLIAMVFLRIFIIQR